MERGFRLKQYFVLAALIFAGPMVMAGDIPSADSTGKSEAKDKKGAGRQLEYVRMTTSMGDIVLELNREKAPITVANFLNYVGDHFYDSTIFHRSIPGFMLQGGGFTADLKQRKPGAPIENEWQNGLKNRRGTIAMARQGRMANSATSQFFINVVDNRGLDVPQDGSGYAVFGQVIAGMDVVDKIVRVPTRTINGMADVPSEMIYIVSVTLLEKKPGSE